MGFRLQQKLMTLNDLERQFTALPPVLCVLFDDDTNVQVRLFLQSDVSFTTTCKTNVGQRFTITNKCADFGTQICRSAEYLYGPPTEGGYSCLDPISTYYIFTTYESASGTISMIQKWLDKLREI